MDLQTWSQFHTKVFNFEMASSKTIQSLKSCFFFVNLEKSSHIATISKIRFLSIFKYFTKVSKILRVYIVLEDTVSKLERFVWIWNDVPIWFLNSPMGKNKIGRFLSSATKNLPLSTGGKLTNHSVRKTCIKTLLDSGVSHTSPEVGCYST